MCNIFASSPAGLVTATRFLFFLCSFLAIPTIVGTGIKDTAFAVTGDSFQTIEQHDENVFTLPDNLFMSTIIIIREATSNDLQQLVQVHVTSWNATYADYHPKPTAEFRESQWRNHFEHKADGWFCFVAEDEGRIVGFATGHDFHDEEIPYKGQLDKIHIYASHHRMGIGERLVKHVVQRFLDNNIHSMILFADPENPNIVFYDTLGGERLKDKDGKFQGAFGWNDIEQLIIRKEI
jgi:GNAT superfamily N-acetyltransferase